MIQYLLCFYVKVLSKFFAINNKCDGNKDLCGLKAKLLVVASEVCGYTKGKPGHFEIWW